MEDKLQKAVLLIADISGYTRFMNNKRLSLAHAQAIITELMEAVIAEIRIPLHIIEVEGDAVFVYGASEPGIFTWDQVLSIIGEKIFDFFRAFYDKLHYLEQSTMCHCSACEGISRLKLKIFLHIGEAVFYQVDRFSKLGGPDVILIHRLLKNSIAADEYLMMTEESFREIRRHKEFDVEKRSEEYEDLGSIDLVVHYPGLSASPGGKAAKGSRRVSVYQKLKQTTKIGIRGMLLMLGLKGQPRFRNLPKQ